MFRIFETEAFLASLEQDFKGQQSKIKAKLTKNEKCRPECPRHFWIPCAAWEPGINNTKPKKET
jgi:hypothetical protein